MNEKKSVNSLKRQMTAAIAMVLVAGIALASATYAWFVTNNTVKATTSTISAQSNAAFMKIKYKKYPNLINSMANRYIVYNQTLDFIEELEKSQDVFVIRPKNPVKIGRTEKNKEKLEALYNEGYNDAKDCYEELIKYLNI